MLQPFHFERDFGAGVPEPAPPQPAKTPAEVAAEQQESARKQALARARAEFEQKLENARKKALEEGFAKGLAEGKAAAEQELAAETHRLARLLTEALPGLAASVEQQAALVAADASAFLGQVITKLLPGLEGALGALRLERFLEEALRSAPKGSSIVVRVRPESVERARAAVERLDLATSSSPPIEIKPDEALDAGAVQVGWGHGGIALAPARVVKAILDACQALGGSEPPPPKRSRPRGRPSSHDPEPLP